MTAVNNPTNNVINDSFEQQARIYKLSLLRTFSLIALIFVAIGVTVSPISQLVSGRALNIVTIFIQSPFLGVAITGYILARKNKYLIASWMLIGTTLVFIATGTFFSDSSLPIIFLFIIPLSLAAFLLGGREVIFVAFICAASTSLSNILQYGIGAYTITPVPAASKAFFSIALAAIFIPAVAALLYLPSRGLLRIIQRQNQELQEALKELEVRRQSSQGVSEKVLDVAETLSDNAQEQAEDSSEQSASIMQLNSSVTELSYAAENIEGVASEIKHASTQVVDDTQVIEQTITRSVKQSEQGMAAVGNTADISGEVAQLYQKLVTALQELNNKSINMRVILDLLSSIAKETHLLALNAAIEAAGVGQHGDRFAVVAQEVKQLAERSAQASNQVVQIIVEIEESAQQSVAVAMEGYSKAKEMEDAAQKTGAVIQQMRTLVEDSQQQATSIGKHIGQVQILGNTIQTATTQQRIALEQVRETLEELTHIATKNASGSQLISDTALKLEELSQGLKVSLTR